MGLKEQLLKGATAVAMPIVTDIIQDMLSAENVAKSGDKLLDAVEDWVTRSETKWDDTLVLPIIGAVRVALNIPDNDEPAG